MKYRACILNTTKNQWLKSEKNGKIRHTENEENKLIFFDETESESTLAFLNDNYAGCYTLLIEANEAAGDYYLYIGGESDGRKISFIEWEEENTGTQYGKPIKTYRVKFKSAHYPDTNRYIAVIWEFILKNNTTGEQIKYKIGEAPQKLKN